MQPIDYGVQVMQPIQAALQGYQAGAAIRDDQQQQQALALQAQQRQAALLAQQQMQQEVAALSSNPSATAKDYAALVMKYPSLREPAKQSWEMVSQDRRAGVQEMLTRAYAATSSGRPDIAQNILRERAAAMRNSGDEAGAKSMEQSAELIGQDPVQARYQIGTFLAGIMEPDKFAETFAKLGAEGRAAELQGPAVREANAKATTAEVTARFAEPTAAADLGKKQADAQKAAVAAKFAESQAVADLKLNAAQIAKMAADTEIARMNARIAAMNAQTSREGNTLKLKELQLKVEEAQQKRDEKVREKVEKATSAAATFDNQLNHIEMVEKNPELNNVVGSWEGRLPAVFSDTAADAIALIDTLGSQTFLSQVEKMKGTGNLSEKEGDKIQAAFVNLSRTQSEKQFRANLAEAKRLVLKNRAALSEISGVPLGKPDTPAKPTAPAGNVTVSGW